MSLGQTSVCGRCGAVYFSYSIQETAARLGVNQSTVRRDIKSGRLPARFTSAGKFEACPADYEVYSSARMASGGRWQPDDACERCGGPIGRSVYGICTRNADCRRARYRAQELTRKSKRRAYRASLAPEQVAANRARAAELAVTDEGIARRLMINCRSRAKVRGTQCTISLEDVLLAVKGGVCQHPACGRTLRRHRSGHGAKVDSYSIDEIIPGRGYVPGNWALLCRGCNTKKSDSTLRWMQATVQMMSDALAAIGPEVTP